MVSSTTICGAWDFIRKMHNAIFTKNQEKSELAGYSIWDFEGGHVCDLNTRLEVNLDSGKTYNIWINP